LLAVLAIFAITLPIRGEIEPAQQQMSCCANTAHATPNHHCGGEPVKNPTRKVAAQPATPACASSCLTLTLSSSLRMAATISSI
jgi:hypothetical protein